jgi:hypothetical protein
VNVTLPGYDAVYVREVCRVSKEHAASSSGYFTALKIGEIFLQNVGELVSDYTASHSR